MPPKKQWEEEESSEESSGPASPPAGAIRRNKFDDEEDEDDVLDSWDAAEDSEVEREKAKKADEAKAKAAAEALKNKKSKAERIAEHQAERIRRAEEDDESGEDETESQRRERLRRTEKESDMKHAEDLFGDIGVPSGRKTNLAGTAVQIDPNDPSKTADIASMPLFNPITKTQFEHLRTTLTPILVNNVKKAHYGLFLQEFAKALAKDLPSDQIKKIASTLTALSNEKMKEEKAAQGGNKKSKAAKTKVSAVISRNTAETETYEEDAFGDDDFM